MNPAIVAPDAFDIVDVALDKGLTPDQVSVCVCCFFYFANGAALRRFSLTW